MSNSVNGIDATVYEMAQQQGGSPQDIIDRAVYIQSVFDRHGIELVEITEVE